MPPLLRPFLFLMLIFIVALLAIRLVGSRQPPSTLALVMSEPDGNPCDHPCVFGVRPGVTTVEQTVALLRAHPLTHDAVWLDDHTLKLAGPSAYVNFSETPNGRVDSISLADDLYDTGIAVPDSVADAYTVGDLILAFGTSNIGIPASGYFVINEPANGMTAAYARPLDWKLKFRPDITVSMFMLSVFRPCPTDGTTVTVYPWMGYIQIERYAISRREFNIQVRESGVRVPPFVTCQE